MKKQTDAPAIVVGARGQTRLATLPMARSAWFVDSDGVRSFSSKLYACARDGR